MPCPLENTHGLPLGQDARLYGSPEGRRYTASLEFFDSPYGKSPQATTPSGLSI